MEKYVSFEFVIMLSMLEFKEVGRNDEKIMAGNLLE